MIDEMRRLTPGLLPPRPWRATPPQDISRTACPSNRPTGAQVNEYDYDASRTEAFLERRGFTRRDLVKLGARSRRARDRPVRHTDRVARAARAENGSPIAKKLPPEWFVNFGTNAEMRWDSVAGLGYTTPNERFFVRDHTGTPIIDAGDLVARVFGTGLEGTPPRLVHLRAAPGPAAEGDRLVHRVRRQRPLASSAPSRARPRRAPSGASARSASRAGAASGSPRSSTAPGSLPTQST